MGEKYEKWGKVVKYGEKWVIVGKSGEKRGNVGKSREKWKKMEKKWLGVAICG